MAVLNNAGVCIYILQSYMAVPTETNRRSRVLEGGTGGALDVGL